MKSCIALPAITIILALGLLSCSGTDVPTGAGFGTQPDELSTLGDRESGEPLVVDFVARRGMRVGTVSVSNDETQLLAEIVTEGRWEMHRTLFAVGRTRRRPSVQPPWRTASGPGRRPGDAQPSGDRFCPLR